MILFDGLNFRNSNENYKKTKKSKMTSLKGQNSKLYCDLRGVGAGAVLEQLLDAVDCIAAHGVVQRAVSRDACVDVCAGPDEVAQAGQRAGAGGAVQGGGAVEAVPDVDAGAVMDQQPAAGGGATTARQVERGSEKRRATRC